MLKRITYIAIFYFPILVGILYSQDWSMTITAQDVSQVGSSDNITLGMCENCHDGFHFGEDEYDLPNGGFSFTDIQFTNTDWLGDTSIHIVDIDNDGILDTNYNTCSDWDFFIDKKGMHEPSDLLTWAISGYSQGLSDIPISLTWGFEDISTDYEIYLYIGETGYNMRSQSSLMISSSDLQSGFDMETFLPLPNVHILIGGCASTGTTTYFMDSDGDGWGTGLPQEYCAGFQPEGLISNDEDGNDEIFCLSNVIDLCDECDGTNACVDCNDIVWGSALLDSCGICSGEETGHVADSDIDCNTECFGTAFFDDCGICAEGSTGIIADFDKDCTGTCFGDAEIDDCNVCDGYNISCLDEIFLSGPENLNAHIHDDVIDITWDQPNYPEETRILGFNIYKQGTILALIANVIEESYTANDSEGTFCVSAYDQYNNESELNCALASEMVNTDFVFTNGANLISFPALPVDTTLIGMFSALGDSIHGVITEGRSAVRHNGVWVGSLLGIEPHRGYWVLIDIGDPFGIVDFSKQGFPTPQTLEYTLFEGANLISYIGNDNVDLSLAIPDATENLFTDVISAGNAAQYHPTLGWIGSLSTFYQGKGYWVKVTQDLSFQWELASFMQTSERRINSTEFSSDFQFKQSTLQSFYFIETIHGITTDNEQFKILAYCNDVVVGSRNWDGGFIDIPAMGDDGEDYSNGYCGEGDTPKFKLYSQGTGVLRNLRSDHIPGWSNNNIQFVTLSIHDAVEIPVRTGIVSAFPNPFNPETVIQYSLESDDLVSITILNINGQLIETLISMHQPAGEHRLIWNAGSQPSGLYLLVLNTSGEYHTQKLMLLK